MAPFKNDLDYHLLRASMVIIFLFFGYQKWFEYEAQALLPYIGHGPLLFWMYPVFGVRGATYFLGVAEWLFAALLFAGYWNKKLGILGALGSGFTFIATTTIIPFMPDGWVASAGGFPAMTEKVAFLMKDLVLFAVSVYLLRQDVIRASLFNTADFDTSITVRHARPTGVVAVCLIAILKFHNGSICPETEHVPACLRFSGIWRANATQSAQELSEPAPGR